MDTIFKLHGMPASIVSDRDKVFVSHFWQELFRLQRTRLNLSTAYHPQTDGQTEVVNRCLETYLRCMTGDKPKDWVRWLPLAEWWFNTTYHSSTGTTPYQVLYGQTPPAHIHYVPESSSVAAVAEWGRSREATMKLIKGHLVQAQNRMKQLADSHRTEREFQVGDWVYLRLQPYKQFSLQARTNMKLSPRYFGPFQVLKKIGKVAYHLNLPPNSRLHPVFHVSLLKKRLGQATTSTIVLPPIGDDGVVSPEPVAILDRRLIKYKGKPATEVLVQWSNSFQEDATWVLYQTLRNQFPQFEPWGQGSS